MNPPRAMKYSPLIAIFLSLPLAFGVPSQAAEDEGEDNQIPINQRATAAAWTALRAGDNKEASEKASECIDRFQKSADTVEAILEQQKTVLPTGDVSREERVRIDRYQILHDVATCLLIKGWAEEKLGQQKLAIASYRQARNYTYARASDFPGAPYWATAEVAAQNLERLSP